MSKFVEIVIGFVGLLIVLFAFVAAYQADKATVYAYPYALDASISARNITAYNVPSIPSNVPDSLSVRLDAANTALTITP